MAKVFTENDDPKVDEFLAKLRDKNHTELDTAKVKITVLFVEQVDANGEATGEQCLKLHGYGAAATIKINSYKDRVEGKDDCTLTIDRACWDKMDQGERLALLDHELLHVVVQFDEEGKVRRDDCNRPVVKLRKHDWQCGGFATIAKRHGDKSIDVKSIMEVNTTFRQLELAFG